MANSLQIKQAMFESGVANETIAKFDFPPEDTDFHTASVLPLIKQMDELLTLKQRLSIMQEQGCAKTGKPDDGSRAFGRDYIDVSLADKVRLFDESKTYNPNKISCRLNADNTLSATFGYQKEGENLCFCSAIKKLKQPARISKTYCGCCGGHARYHLENALGVELRLKKIISSSISSGGRKRCEFLFDVCEI